MKKKLGIAIAAGTMAATIGLGAPGSASAAPSDNGACVQAGLGTLKELGLLQQAAQKKLDYGVVLPEVFPEGTFLSLGQVVKAHTTNPELFPWCAD